MIAIQSVNKVDVDDDDGVGVDGCDGGMDSKPTSCHSIVAEEQDMVEEEKENLDPLIHIKEEEATDLIMADLSVATTTSSVDASSDHKDHVAVENLPSQQETNVKLEIRLEMETKPEMEVKPDIKLETVKQVVKPETVGLSLAEPSNVQPVYLGPAPPCTQPSCQAHGGRCGQFPTIGAESYYGYVETVEDAIMIVEACRFGRLARVRRRLADKERLSIRSGSVFVFVERESGIRRWTDGKLWSPSRICGEFLLYRELEQRASPAPKRTISASEQDSNETPHNNNSTPSNIKAVNRPTLPRSSVMIPPPPKLLMPATANKMAMRPMNGPGGAFQVKSFRPPMIMLPNGQMAPHPMNMMPPMPVQAQVPSQVPGFPVVQAQQVQIQGNQMPVQAQIQSNQMPVQVQQQPSAQGQMQHSGLGQAPAQQMPQPVQAQQMPQPFQAQQMPQPVQAQQMPQPFQAQQMPQPVQAQQMLQPFQAQQMPQPVQVQQPVQMVQQQQSHAPPQMQGQPPHAQAQAQPMHAQMHPQQLQPGQQLTQQQIHQLQVQHMMAQQQQQQQQQQHYPQPFMPQPSAAKVNSMNVFKKDGLIKKTISLNIADETYHLICYFRDRDLATLLLPLSPSRNPVFGVVRQCANMVQLPVFLTTAGSKDLNGSIPMVAAYARPPNSCNSSCGQACPSAKTCPNASAAVTESVPANAQPEPSEDQLLFCHFLEAVNK